MGSDSTSLFAIRASIHRGINEAPTSSRSARKYSVGAAGQRRADDFQGAKGSIHQERISLEEAAGEAKAGREEVEEWTR